MKKNVLVTAIGSMSSEEVVRSLVKNGYRVFGTDIYPAAWTGVAHLYEQVYQVPLVSDAHYISELLAICKKKKINYLIPLTDLEVDALSLNRSIFEKENIIVTIPSKQCVELCRDKLNFFKFFKNNAQIKCIPTYTYQEILDNHIPLPIIAKIINGRSSENLHLIESQDFLKYFASTQNNYIFQPFINGNIYDIDYVRDFYGNDVAVARKEILRSKTGYCITAKIQQHSILEQTTKLVCRALDVVGCINLEFIESDGMYYLMDINPRFSAGLGFTQRIGYDMVLNHIKCFNHEIIDHINIFQQKVITKRYDFITYKENTK